MIKALFSFVKPYWVSALLAPLSIVGEVLLEVRIPLLMSQIVDVGLPNGDIPFIIQKGLLMVAMAILSLCCGAASAYFAARAGMGFGAGLRRALFAKIEGFSYSNIDKFSTASLITRLTTDVNNIQMAFMMVLRMMVRSPVMLVSATIMTFTINRSLVSVFLVAIPILVTGILLISIVSFPRFQIMMKKYDGLNSSVQEALIGCRVVKAFVRSDHEKEKFRSANDALTKASIRAERVLMINMPLMQLVMYGCIIAVMWFGGKRIVVGEMQTGQLISFISYISQILMSLMMISMIFIQTILSRASLTRVVEVLNETPDIQDLPGRGLLSVKNGSVEFEDVSFAYPNCAPVLFNVNLKIQAGQTIGIIGGTGSSKSTLVQLIPRLYEATSGRVLVGGRDVKDYSLRELRDSVSMVLQNNLLFTGTILENLRWGNETATMEEVEAAARAAQAHDFITSFPKGYHTVLGQGGVNVSGGQKQRLCIARALLKRPKIIILDDSTSAVDTATDAKIRKALRETLTDTTTFIITQRIASVENADQIVVLDEGRVCAVGNHAELLKQSEIYREVYESQKKGVE